MPPIPSKHALRHLARLCQLSGTVSSRSTTTAALCHHRPTTVPQCNNRQHHIAYRELSTSSNYSISPSSLRRADQRDAEQPTASLPDITNYYTLFPTTLPNGPPSYQNSGSSFSIQLPTLRKEFLRLQSLHHPDKYDPSTSAHQKAQALSSLINNAYKTLSDPLLRAQYLLQLNHDIDVTSEDNSAHPTDQATLMDVMEAQERIEEAETQDDIDALKAENEDRISNTVNLMGKAFEDGDVDAAKNECVKLKYWRSLQQGLHDWEPGKEVRLIH